MVGRLELNACTVDLQRCEVVGASGHHTLTPQEAQLLAFLARRPGTVVSTRELQTEVWGYSPSVNSSAVAVAVRRLRKKIERVPGSPESLKTVRGIGYLLQLRPPASTQERGALLGRTATLAALQTSQHPLVCLVGPPGVGKTSLARVCAASWEGECAFASLRSCDSIDEVIDALAAAVQAKPPPTERLEWFGEVMQNRPGVLWVLDDADGCVAAVEQVLAVLEPAMTQGQRVVVTSRAAVAGATAVTVPPLDPGSAVELFTQHAHRARVGLAFGAEDSERLHTICSQLEGLPLAIVLAGARMSVLSLGQLEERLADQLHVLRSPQLGGDPTHASLEAAITVSWELLPPEHRWAFAQCAVFRGGFTIEAAEAVIDGGTSSVVDALQALTSASLVQAEETDPALPVRFHLLPSLAAYAEARLAEASQAARTALEVAHGQWFAGFADTVRERWCQGSVERCSALAAERNNLERACWSAIGRADVAVTSSTALGVGEISRVTGATAPALTLITSALEVARAPELLVEAANLCRVGERLEDARRYAEEALTVEDGDPHIRALATSALAVVVHRAEGPLQARARYEAALGLYREVGDRREEGMTLALLGATLRQLGDPAAHPTYLEALAVVRDVGDRRTEAEVLSNLGLLLQDRGESLAAGDCHRQALEIQRALGARSAAAGTLGRLGEQAQDIGDYDEARRYYTEALALVRYIGVRREAWLLSNLAQIHAAQGELELAQDCQEQALAMDRRIGNRRGAAVSIGILGSYLQARGQLSAAHRHYQTALAAHRELGNRRSEGVTLVRLGALHRERGELEDARRCIAAARVLLREVGYRVWRGVALGELARVERDAHRPNHARACLADAEVFLEGVSPSDRVGLLCTRAELEHDAARHGPARAALTDARRLAAEIRLAPRSLEGRRLAEVAERVEALPARGARLRPADPHGTAITED